MNLYELLIVLEFSRIMHLLVALVFKKLTKLHLNKKLADFRTLKVSLLVKPFYLQKHYLELIFLE